MIVWSFFPLLLVKIMAFNLNFSAAQIHILNFYSVYGLVNSDILFFPKQTPCGNNALDIDSINEHFRV